MKKIITNDDFGTMLSDEKAVVKIGLPGCAPCHRVGEFLAGVENDYPEWNFYEIDAEECEPDIVDDLRIRNVPTVVFYVNGGEKKRLIGGLPNERYVEQLTAN